MEKYNKPIHPLDVEKGLTKREYFAGILMHAFVSDSENHAMTWEHIAIHAIGAAEALIKELECE